MLRKLVAGLVALLAVTSGVRCVRATEAQRALGGLKIDRWRPDTSRDRARAASSRASGADRR